MIPELIITTPDGGTRAVRLDGVRYSLGRATANELSLPEDAGLSRQHLVFELLDDSWTIADLGSKNGTLLNGVRLTGRQVLQPGDVVSASYTRLVFGESAITPAAGADRTVTFQPGVPVPVTAIEGSRLPELETRAQWWESPVTTMLHATRELVAKRRLSQLFPLVFQLASEVVGGAEGVLLMRDGNDLIVRAASGSGFQIPAAVRDEVLLHGVPLLQPGEPEFLAVPLQIAERVQGMFYFERGPDRPGRPFASEDMSLLMALGSVAARCAEQLHDAESEEARRILQLEIEQATDVKRKLLPVSVPMVAGFDLAFHHEPCGSVAGDFFQYVQYASGRIGIMISDIAGRGMPVALVLTSLRARIDVLAETVEDPGQLLTRLNRMVSTIRPDNRLLTAFYCILDPVSGMTTYSNGGHLPGLLVREDGHQEQLRRGGMALGAMSRMQYESGQVFLDTDDVVVLYSDSVIEMASAKGEEFGEERLLDVVTAHRAESAAELVAAVREALGAWSQGAAVEDDVTVMVVKRLAC